MHHACTTRIASNGCAQRSVSVESITSSSRVNKTTRCPQHRFVCLLSIGESIHSFIGPTTNGGPGSPSVLGSSEFHEKPVTPSRSTLVLPQQILNSFPHILSISRSFLQSPSAAVFTNRGPGSPSVRGTAGQNHTPRCLFAR